MLNLFENLVLFSLFEGNAFIIVLMICIILLLGLYLLFLLHKRTNLYKIQDAPVIDEEKEVEEEIDEVQVVAVEEVKELEAKQESEPEIEQEKEQESEVEPESETEQEPETEVEQESEPEVEQEPEPEVEQESEPEQEPEPEQESEPEQKSEPEQEPETESEPLVEEQESTLVAHHMEDLVRESVTVEEASETLSDSTTNKLVTVEKVKLYGGKREKYIINIDTIGENFENGDTVNLHTLKEKGLLPKKCNFFKVLARGRLSKALTVIANDYSKDAIKMILITGGNVTILEEK